MSVTLFDLPVGDVGSISLGKAVFYSITFLKGLDYALVQDNAPLAAVGGSPLLKGLAYAA